MANAIELRDVRKRFGRVMALNGVDLVVGAGQVHGLLGPNGAGKSTTVRVLLGLLRADGGFARVLGEDPWEAAPSVRSRLAYVPGDVSLWPNLTGGEVLDVLARMHGGEDRRRRDELVERFELDPTRRCRAYSKGNRQKVGLIAAFSARAELLILDEPTSGLDPLMEEVFKQCVREAHGAGATVLLSSHILSEVEQLCDRVSVVRAGRVVDSGSLADLRGYSASTIEATLEHPAEGLERLSDVRDLSIDGDRVRFTTTSFDAVMPALVERGIRTLTVSPPSLEDLFLHYYDRARDGVPA